jgi:ubiquinone/menaquinone biosynthesis C-methylase UbiE
MSRLRSRILSQFGRPSGALGALAGAVMAHRGSNQRRNAWTVQLLDIHPDDRVLEIGYGPGLAIHRAAELASHGRVLGIDHSQVMQRQARRRNRHAVASGQVQLLRGGVADLAGRAAEFHKVLAVNVFGFWPDPVAVLRQVAAVLLPGARIALTMQPRGHGVTNEHTRQAGERLGAALHDAGFTDIQVHTLALEPVDAACAVGVWPSLPPGQIRASRL